jgi:hypothetical protein
MVLLRWGNEAQTYTNSSDNVIVAWKFKNHCQKSFSVIFVSMKSEGKYKFTYGKVEVRAKLTTGGGTWPAIWMLGSDYATNTWPGCGEIDIMEHEPNVIHGTHIQRSGGNAMEIKLLRLQFHVYKTIWSPKYDLYL